MPVQFTPIIILYFISAAITLYITLQTWIMRPAQGATYWAMTMLFASIYVLASGLEVLFTNPIWKYQMIPVIYCGLTGFIVFWILFCIQYSHHDNWINPVSVTLLSIIPITTFILTLFLDHHQLIYREYEFIEQNGLLLSNVVAYGWFFIVWATFSYVMVIFGAVLVIHAAWRYPHLFQGQAIAVAISVLIPVMVSLPYTLGINPIDPLDPSPFSITLSGIVMYFAMSRYHFLKTSSIAYDVVFNHVSSAVLIVDMKDCILNMNNVAERVFHQARNHVVGKPIQDALPQFYAIAQAFQGVSQVTSDVIIENTHYEMKITPLKNRRGKPDGRIVMLYDISDRIQMEKQAIQLAVERDRVDFLKQFINDASHDLKTPLSIMKTEHYLLRRELGEAASKRVNTLSNQTDRLIKLVDDMLTMVRLDEQGTISLHKTNLNELIQSVISSCPVPDGHTIQFEPASDIPQIHISHIELSQALSHLLKNAITHTPPNGDIVVRADAGDDSIQISVRDTGTGIPDEDLPHIFERFYRGDKARGMETGSSGLGLAIVKRIVERHGGSIDVTSTIGEGSEFCIRMPVFEQASLAIKPKD